MTHSQPRWWESRAFICAALLASILPLLWPAIPPLADLPGHIGRYHIASAIDASPDLQRHWRFEWAVIGNLGVDLPVYALTPLLGVEPAAKLVVMLIPAVFVSGLISITLACGRRLSPAAGFAFPLAYSFPFQFGFVNFMLSVGLAFHALALWIMLGRKGRIALRTALFVPIACMLWLAHSSGWGLFGLLAFAAELVRLRQRGRAWLAAWVGAGLACVPLALPVLWMVGDPAGGEPVLWDWKAKASWIPSLLRERWKWYDVACAAIELGVLWMAIRNRWARFDALNGAAALIAFVAFLALPRLALGGSYVDMRLLAPAIALALIAIRIEPGHERIERRLALAAAGFLTLRTISSTVAMLLAAGPQQHALEVTPHIPRGAALLVLVKEPCSSQWSNPRLAHIAGIITARRDVFESGQWTLGGQQLLRHRHPQAAPYATDPGQLVYPATCEYRPTDFATAVRDFDRGTFTHVLTLDFPAMSRLAPDVRLVWSNGVSALYAVDRAPTRLPRAAASQ